MTLGFDFANATRQTLVLFSFISVLVPIYGKQTLVATFYALHSICAILFTGVEVGTAMLCTRSPF